MSQNLTLELSDPVFTAIRQQAESLGIPPERLVTDFVEQKFFHAGQSLLAETDKEVTRSNFERHFGMLELDSSVDVDNESIDADLAIEYTSLNEDD